MAKFTIARAGQTITEVTLTGERIELGSAKSCQLFIDDLLIALKQAVFVRTEGGDAYRLESLTDIPKSTLDGSVVSAPVDLNDGAVLHVEGYDITITESDSYVGIIGNIGAGSAAQGIAEVSDFDRKVRRRRRHCVSGRDKNSIAAGKFVAVIKKVNRCTQVYLLRVDGWRDVPGDNHP